MTAKTPLRAYSQSAPSLFLRQRNGTCQNQMMLLAAYALNLWNRGDCNYVVDQLPHNAGSQEHESGWLTPADSGVGTAMWSARPKSRTATTIRGGLLEAAGGRGLDVSAVAGAVLEATVHKARAAGWRGRTPRSSPGAKSI